MDRTLQNPGDTRAAVDEPRCAEVGEAQSRGRNASCAIAAR